MMDGLKLMMVLAVVDYIRRCHHLSSNSLLRIWPIVVDVMHVIFLLLSLSLYCHSRHGWFCRYWNGPLCGLQLRLRHRHRRRRFRPRFSIPSSSPHSLVDVVVHKLPSTINLIPVVAVMMTMMIVVLVGTSPHPLICQSLVAPLMM